MLYNYIFNRNRTAMTSPKSRNQQVRDCFYPPAPLLPPSTQPLYKKKELKNKINQIEERTSPVTSACKRTACFVRPPSLPSAAVNSPCRICTWARKLPAPPRTPQMLCPGYAPARADRNPAGSQTPQFPGTSCLLTTSKPTKKKRITTCYTGKRDIPENVLNNTYR